MKARQVKVVARRSEIRLLRGCAFSAKKGVIMNRQWDSDRSFNCGIVENELERVSAYRGVAPQVR